MLAADTIVFARTAFAMRTTARATLAESVFARQPAVQNVAVLKRRQHVTKDVAVSQNRTTQRLCQLLNSAAVFRLQVFSGRHRWKPLRAVR